MKKIYAKTTITNKHDLHLYQNGVLSARKVRKISIPLNLEEHEPYLFLPKQMIQDLGIPAVYQGIGLGKRGFCKKLIYGPVELGSSGKTVFVQELPEGFPPSLGSNLFLDLPVQLPR